MRYSGYQNILSKLRYDYGSFDKDLRRFLIMIWGMFTFIAPKDFFGIPVGVQSTPQEDFVNIVELNNFEYKKRDTCKYLD